MVGRLRLAVYDVTRPETFDNLSKWLEEVETYHPGRGREVRHGRRVAGRGWKGASCRNPDGFKLMACTTS